MHDTIDVEESRDIDYDIPMNGMRVLVTEKLIIFNCPEDLLEGSSWVDIEGVRHFSPGYFADVFEDFGVQLVVRACEGDYDISAFTDRGIEVEDLFFDDVAVEPLAATVTDRFLSLVHHVPGAMAVHCGSDGLGMAATLIAAHLLLPLT